MNCCMRPSMNRVVKSLGRNLFQERMGETSYSKP
jgi:hypothetical protein